MITVIRQRRYVASDRFVSWVCRIARNLVIDYFRKGRGEAACSDLELDVELLRGNAYQEESQEDRMVYAQILMTSSDSFLIYQQYNRRLFDFDFMKTCLSGK